MIYYLDPRDEALLNSPALAFYCCCGLEVFEQKACSVQRAQSELIAASALRSTFTSPNTSYLLILTSGKGKHPLN